MDLDPGPRRPQPCASRLRWRTDSGLFQITDDGNAVTVTLMPVDMASIHWAPNHCLDKTDASIRGKTGAYTDAAYPTRPVNENRLGKAQVQSLPEAVRPAVATY